MKNRKLSRHELDASTVKFTERSRSIVKIVETLVKYGTIAFIFFIAGDVIKSLAGKTTLANIVISIFADLKINQWIFYIFGTTGFIYGVSQHKLRKRNIERMSKRKDELEKKVNPGKITSNLMPNGNTNRGDL